MCTFFFSWQAQRELNDPENAAIGAFAGNIEVQICELPSFPPYDTNLLIEFGYLIKGLVEEIYTNYIKFND